jgi:segregation and condensation protein B
MEVLNPQDASRILEAALLCAHQPMTLRDMRQLFDDTVSADTVRAMLASIASQWDGRGVELRELATGWRFQTRADVQAHLDRLNPEKPPKYSRATLETLAIIAYKQPVTRGDIEDIRGVTVSTNIVKQTWAWLRSTSCPRWRACPSARVCCQAWTNPMRQMRRLTRRVPRRISPHCWSLPRR